jgi:hypothetical protein
MHAEDAQGFVKMGSPETRLKKSFVELSSTVARVFSVWTRCRRQSTAITQEASQLPCAEPGL